MKRKRKETKEKFINKLAHLKAFRKKEIEENFEAIPEELIRFAVCKIFSNKKFEDILPRMNDDEVIGDIVLDEEERSILRMNPKFAVLQRLNSEQQEREIEIRFSKMR